MMIEFPHSPRLSLLSMKTEFDTQGRQGAFAHVMSAVPTFLVADVAATARWYADQLGFHTVGHVPESPPYVYASLQRDGAEIMLLNLEGYEKPDLANRRPAGLWDAYFRMNGVLALYRTVRHHAWIKMALKKQPYGDWEFEVRDPNGYVLVFGGDAHIPEGGD
jgi:catechol 2,3-dioxygenase-like lactoylglutathione lyase family enzyme